MLGLVLLPVSDNLGQEWNAIRLKSTARLMPKIQGSAENRLPHVAFDALRELFGIVRHPWNRSKDLLTSEVSDEHVTPATVCTENLTETSIMSNRDRLRVV